MYTVVQHSSSQDSSHSISVAEICWNSFQLCILYHMHMRTCMLTVLSPSQSLSPSKFTDVRSLQFLLWVERRFLLLYLQRNQQSQWPRHGWKAQVKQFWCSHSLGNHFQAVCNWRPHSLSWQPLHCVEGTGKTGQVDTFWLYLFHPGSLKGTELDWSWNQPANCWGSLLSCLHEPQVITCGLHTKL